MTRADIRSGRTARVEYHFFGEGPLVNSLRNIVSIDHTGETALQRGSRSGTTTRKVAVLALDSGDFSQIVLDPTSVRRNTIDVLIDSTVRSVRRHDIEHIVVLSSAAICGAWRDRVPIVDEEVRVANLDSGWVGDIAYGETRLVQALESDEAHVADSHAAPRVTVLRAASLVGPELDTMITRHFEVPRLLELRDSAKRWQFLHVSDLASAIRVVITDEITGTLTVGAVKEDPGGAVIPDTENTKTIATIAGRRVVSLSETAAMNTAERLHRAGLLAVPASDIAYAVYPWTVLPHTLADHGWRSEHSTAECAHQIAAHVTARHGIAGGLVKRRSVAALGAAGAAVALAGTIAAMRRSRGVS